MYYPCMVNLDIEGMLDPNMHSIPLPISPASAAFGIRGSQGNPRSFGSHGLDACIVEQGQGSSRCSKVRAGLKMSRAIYIYIYICIDIDIDIYIYIYGEDRPKNTKPGFVKIAIEAMAIEIGEFP